MESLDLSLDIPGAPINLHAGIHQPITSNVRGDRTSVPRERTSPALNEEKVRRRVAAVIRDIKANGSILIPAESKVRGEVQGSAVGVLGTVHGKVASRGAIFVHVGAAVIGKVKSEDIVLVSGTIQGEPNSVAIESKGWVVLSRSAHVIGHIKCRTVFIFDGAKVLGTIQPVDE